jgi:hypothetical protein
MRGLRIRQGWIQGNHFAMGSNRSIFPIKIMSMRLIDRNIVRGRRAVLACLWALACAGSGATFEKAKVAKYAPE